MDIKDLLPDSQITASFLGATLAAVSRKSVAYWERAIVFLTGIACAMYAIPFACHLFNVSDSTTINLLEFMAGFCAYGILPKVSERLETTIPEWIASKLKAKKDE